jgi:hypothetical protein
VNVCDLDHQQREVAYEHSDRKASRVKLDEEYADRKREKQIVTVIEPSATPIKMSRG